MVLELIVVVICVYLITNMNAQIKITINKPEQKVEVPMIQVQEKLDEQQDEASSVNDLVKSLNEFMMGGD